MFSLSSDKIYAKAKIKVKFFDSLNFQQEIAIHLSNQYSTRLHKHSSDHQKHFYYRRCSSCHSSLRVIYVVCHSTFLLRSSKPYITKISIMCIGHSVTLISVRSASSVKSITTAPFGGVGGQTCRMVECGPTVALSATEYKSRLRGLVFGQ